MLNIVTWRLFFTKKFAYIVIWRYLCINQSSTMQIYIIDLDLQNIFNQKVTNMEEKNLNEAQVAEQTTSQDENKNMSEVDALKAEIKKLNETIDYLRTSNSREYRKVDILKGALKMLKDKYSVSDSDYYGALICGGDGELDIDDILYQLSK